jgi:RNA polymerase sigma-70 factor (ECF subfamily)
MVEEVTATEPIELVDHFFRHESAKLLAVLTRAFGLARLELVEECVQEAMMAALKTWRQRGVPDNPGGWIHRVARNRALDALRRERTHQRALSLSGQTEEATEALIDDWLLEERLPDSLLRMMFVCCHPALDQRSQIALTLNILCGFSVAEVSRGLLITTEAGKKRIQRAKRALAAARVRVDLPPAGELKTRLAVVQTVLYVMFNEGYSTSRGHEPLRDDVCEEAARLCHLLCEHEAFSTPSTRALLALMLFHGARLEARVDSEGAAVLLEDQDRSRWDRLLIRVGESWLERARTDHLSRFHLEAAIAHLHCQAPSVSETPWYRIVGLYDRLLSLHDSPIYALNRAIALGESGRPEAALAEIEALRDGREMREYYLLDSAAGRLHELLGDNASASAAYRRARSAAGAPHARSLLDRKLERLR